MKKDSPIKKLSKHTQRIATLASLTQCLEQTGLIDKFGKLIYLAFSNETQTVIGEIDTDFNLFKDNFKIILGLVIDDVCLRFTEY